MVIKGREEHHFVREFPGMKSMSRRVMLPDRDDTRVKTTDVLGIAGEEFSDIRNDTDETVIIVSGEVLIRHNGNEYGIKGPAVYFVPAGELYSVAFVKNTRAFCVFSEAADGTLPQNEDDPES